MCWWMRSCDTCFREQNMNDLMFIFYEIILDENNVPQIKIKIKGSSNTYTHIVMFIIA